MFHRYSDDVIEAVEMLDNDEKIDLELIVALIRHIVLKEEVRLTVFQDSCLKVANLRCHNKHFCHSKMKMRLQGIYSEGVSRLRPTRT